jgi:hypothetical protein
MKRILQILALLSLTVIVNGQTWAPTGAKWTYGVSYAFSPHIDYREWISTGDTIVGGHTCKLIKNMGSDVNMANLDKLITYEEGNIVYWYNINQFTVLYDFNKNAGDTWTIFNDTCSALVTVDSTGFDTINGYPLKALYLSSDDGVFSGKALEHIGNLDGPAPYFLFHCTGIIVDGSFYTGLRCYEDSVFGFYNFEIAPSCDYVYTGMDEPATKSGVQLFPNPATDRLNIRTTLYGKITFIIYNMTGDVVLTGISENLAPISTARLATGLYTLELKAGGQTLRQSFEVKR